MKTYCVRQKKKTECVPGTERVKLAKNGRQMLVCECAECGATKTQFMGLDKKRMDLISSRIKRNVDLKNLWKEVESRRNKMTDEEKGDIRRKARNLQQKKRDIAAELKEIETILNSKAPVRNQLELPDLSEFKSRPDLDERYEAIIKNWNQMNKPKRKPQKTVKLELPDLSEFQLRPDLDERYEAIIKNWNQMNKPKRKPKKIVKHELPDLSEFQLCPDLDEKFQKLVDENALMRKSMKKKPSNTKRKNAFENWSKLSQKEVDRRINQFWDIILGYNER